MDTPALDRVISGLDPSKVSLFEWTLNSDKLFLSPGYLANASSVQKQTMSFPILWKRIDRRDRRKLVAKFNDHPKNQIPLEADFRVTNPDGKLFLVRCQGTFSRDRNNNPSHLTGTLTNRYEFSSGPGNLANIQSDPIIFDPSDIAEPATEQNRPQSSQHTNEQLEQFAYAASHDLRAPLRGLKSLIQWIEEDMENPADHIRRHLQLMKRRVLRMENLLQDIMAYSKAGQRNEEPRLIQLALFIEEIWDCAQPPPGFSLSVDLEYSTVYTSKTLLEQTLSNLISNGLKHHDRPTGKIGISYKLGKYAHHFLVEDDGPGIAPKYRDRIFQIFQTLKPKDEVEGSGLGLAIVQKNLESLGQRIWIESGETTRGTVFHFTLPIASSNMKLTNKPPSTGRNV